MSHATRHVTDFDNQAASSGEPIMYQVAGTRRLSVFPKTDDRHEDESNHIAVMETRNGDFRTAPFSQLTPFYKRFVRWATEEEVIACNTTLGQWDIHTGELTENGE